MKTFTKPNIEIADVFNKFSHLLGSMPLQQHKVIAAIRNCRTASLGGHKLKCGKCDFEKNFYNSCRNRHCPKCQFLSQVRWIEKREADLLPCQYFHVVFTVPSELKCLMLRNKKTSYDILFQAASQTLKEVAGNPQHLGAEIGAIGVLHTWGQNLKDHPHIHFIVPGGGLNKNKRPKWLSCKKDYFLPIQVLSKVYRAKILASFEKSFDKGQLKFMGSISYLSHPACFKELLMTCAAKEFNVYAKKPFAGPKQVIKYLGQYTHRIAISNYRLVKIEGEKIYFKVRDKENPGEKKVISLHVKEFMRRFLLHVLPKGYVRIRHFGLLASRMKRIKIGTVRALHGITKILKKTSPPTWRELLRNFSQLNADQCPKCGALSLFKALTIPPLLNTA
jgi:hypothetical protein